ncbi:MAG: Imidazoleglycerol-phosphate dehydratase [Candidatus Dichloromethanomonas elyunquensis]|nr:MAG: Imidazoleglycerol-phosphate dehydratase [Candidatus Dichloromethanomonas elyunquensis]
MRTASLTRKTLETDIMLALSVDGQGRTNIETGIGFFDHMLNSLCRFAYFDLDLKAEGDLQVDPHHTIEDCGIVLGQALREALGDKAGIERVGDCLFPMDEALVQAAVDISNRGYLSWKVDCPEGMTGGFPAEMAEEFFRALAVNAGITLHIVQLSGKNSHHILEAAFKSAGRALRLASSVNKRIEGILSTKGAL